MISGLAPYIRYKESGHAWVGRTPDHWTLLPNRALFAEVKDRGHPAEEMLSVTITRGVIQQKALLADSSKKDRSNRNRAAYKLVCPGDIAYNKMRAWQGSIGMSRHRGIISPAYVVQRLRGDSNPRYFHWLFRTPHFAKEAERWSYGITSDMWSLRPEHFKMIYCAVPPREEQDAIVRLLDHVDRRLERAIRAQKRLIALLNEQKQAVIDRTVIRGLDLNVQLKPSGLPWIGSIPAHWRPLQLRRFVSLVTSGSRGWARYYSDEGAVFLQSGNLGRSMALNLSFVQHVRPPEGSEGTRTKVSMNDLLLCITGALTGNVVLVDVDLPNAFVNQHVALIRPKADKVFPRFLAYMLHSGVGQAQFRTSEYGGTKQGLGLGDVKSVVTALPPLREQEVIARHLDEVLANLTAPIAQAQREIELIREYRTRLIVELVTGQLDVRAAANNLPSEVQASESAIAPEAVDETEELLEAVADDE